MASNHGDATVCVSTHMKYILQSPFPVNAAVATEYLNSVKISSALQSGPSAGLGSATVAILLVVSYISKYNGMSQNN